MRKVLIATGVALVAGSPLAFAAHVPPRNEAIAPTAHCSHVDAAYNRAGYPTARAFPVSLQQAQALCREDRHKHDDRTAGNVAR